jgi:hypothetical protein
MKKKLSKLAGIQKSWTMYSAALLLAAPELLTFLPTVKEQMPVEFYSWVYKLTIALFIILRIKTQVQK